MYFRFRNMLPDMLIIWIVPIFLLIMIVISIYMIGKNKKQNNHHRNDSSLEILNKRFAKSEIDEEEYIKKKRNLNS